MSDRLLTTEERSRFARYCREQAMSCEAIAKQMESMLHLEPVARLQRNNALAYAIVAKDLESVEEETIGEA
jgi:hypothetical protein